MKFIIEQSGVKFEYPITESEIVVGRSRECDIAIHDEKVSSRHFRLKNDGNKIFVQDLLSKNGTFMNGEKIETVEIRDGDVINIGSTNLIFKSEAAVAPGAEQPQYQQYQQGAPQPPSSFANASTMPAGMQAPFPSAPMSAPTYAPSQIPQPSQPGAIQPYTGQPQDPNMKIITQGDKVYMVDTQHERMVEIVPAGKAAGAQAIPAGASTGDKIKYFMLKYKKASLVMVVVAIVFVVLIAMAVLSPSQDTNIPGPGSGNRVKYDGNLEIAMELFDKENKFEEAMATIDIAKTFVPAGAPPKIANALAGALNRLHSIDPKSIKPGTWTQLIDSLSDLAGETPETSKIYAFAQRKKDWAYAERKNEASYKGILDEYNAGNAKQAYQLIDQFPADSIYSKLAAELKGKLNNSIVEGHKNSAQACMDSRDWTGALNEMNELSKYLAQDDKWLKSKKAYCETARSAKNAYDEAKAAFDGGNIAGAVTIFNGVKDYGPYEVDFVRLLGEIEDATNELDAMSKFNEGKTKEAKQVLSKVGSPNVLSQQLITFVEEEFKAASEAEAGDQPWVALERWTAVKGRLATSYFANNVFLRESDKKLREYKKETDWDQSVLWLNTGKERYNTKKYKSARMYFEEAVRASSNPQAVEEITKMKQRSQVLKNEAMAMNNQDPPNLIDAQKKLEEALEMLLPSDGAFPKTKELYEEVKAKRNNK
ncbi:MAG: FHA domain-containing protein [Planctomycetes bacterium]|nr:FHA domain-containing protein [Planctomycetota bacterium]